MSASDLYGQLLYQRKKMRQLARDHKHHSTRVEVLQRMIRKLARQIRITEKDLGWSSRLPKS